MSDPKTDFLHSHLSPSELQRPVEALMERRRFLRNAGTAALSLAGASLLARGADASATGGLDTTVLNFALNLEYLEGEYYSYALTGAGLEGNGIATGGQGKTGPVTIKANPKVPFQTSLLQQFGQEITTDEMTHVQFVRKFLARLGVQPIARPPIDLLNSFNALAQAAGLGTGFDPFADEVSFFIGGYILSDVGVTAYKGSARLLTNPDVIENASGLLAVEAFHAANIRTNLILADAMNPNATVGGVSNPTTPGVAANVQLISNFRDNLDGASRDSNGVYQQDSDQGIIGDTDQPGFPRQGLVNFAPGDVNAVAIGRTARQVLNVVYSDPTGNAHSGGFFPSGANGALS